MNEKHVYVVEDEIHTRLALNVILRSAGYKVTISCSCAEALEMFTDGRSTERPDLLVTDIYTPEMTGVQLVAELKKNNIDIPTLIITGFRERDTMQDLQQLGCRHFLYKPFSDEEFLRKVRQVMGMPL